MAAALMSTMKMNKAERPLVKLECLRLLARLKLDPARSKLIGGFVDSYLNLTAQEMKTFEREREKLLPKEREETVALISRWESKGIELGLEQGRQEGLQEGIIAGLHDGKEQLIIRLINRRIGDVNPILSSRIAELTPALLDDLGEALLDFNDFADLERWLTTRSAA